MKTLTNSILAAALTVFATGAMAALSPASAPVGSSPTSTEIESQLSNWCKKEHSNLTSVARGKNDRLPMYVREQQAKAELDSNYEQLRMQYRPHMSNDLAERTVSCSRIGSINR